MKQNILKTKDFYIQIAITIVGILTLSLGIELITAVHSGYDPLDGFFIAIVATVQHIFPSSGWDYKNGQYIGYVVWIFMFSIFLVDLLILRKLKKLNNWINVMQLVATLSYAFLSGKLIIMWSKVLHNIHFISWIQSLYDNNNYFVIVPMGGVAVLILALGVATFIRGFLFQGPYNGFTIWSCIAFRTEYKYFRIAADVVTGLISVVLFLICISYTEYHNLFGIPTLSPLFFGIIVHWILKFYDKVIGKYAKINL